MVLFWEIGEGIEGRWGGFCFVYRVCCGGCLMVVRGMVRGDFKFFIFFGCVDFVFGWVMGVGGCNFEIN